MALEPAGVTFIAENIDEYIRDLSKADKAQLGLGDSAEKSSGGLNILGGVITGVAMAVTTFAIDAVMKASQALVGFAADSIQVATDFESSMATLSIAASATSLSFDELSETALAVGGDTSLLGVSASGAAESMEGLFKAGLTTEEVFGDLQGYLAGTAELGGTLRASIDLAAATTLDMVAASDVAAIALATFGGEAEEAGISTDEWINAAMNNLVQAADASVAEVDGLVEALKMVGPAASAMGVTLEETNNALALLSTRGIQGSSAGTSLNRMMLDLVKGTSESAEMMEDLGISVYDSTGSFLPLVEIIGQFEIALGDATDAERDAAMSAIFTAQGARAMNTLLEEGVQGWVDMTDATADAATMQEQAAVKGETLAAQQEALEGVIETLQIKIGSALLPALTDMTTIFAGLIDKYGPALSEAFEKVGTFLSDLVAGAHNLIEVFSTGGLEGIVTVWEDGSSAVSNFLETLGLSEDVASGVSGAMGSVVDAIDSIRQWFDDNGPVIESSLDQIGQVFGMVFGSIWEVVQDSIMPALQEVWAVFQETWDVVKDVLGEFGLEFDDTGSGIETVTGIIIGVIEIMGGIIAGVLTAVSGTVKFFAEHFKGVWESIQDVVQGVKEWFEGFKQFWVSLFEGDLPGAFEGLKKVFAGVWKTIKGTVNLIVRAITMPFAGLYKLIEGFVKGVIDYFKNLKKKLVGGSIIPDMMDKIKKVITVVLSAVRKVFSDILKKIKDKIREVFESIRGTIDRVINKVKDIIKTVSETIQKVWEKFTDDLQEIWETIWGAIEKFVDTTFSAIEKLIDTISGNIQKAWETFTEAVQEAWETIWGAIETFVGTTFGNIETFIDTVSGNIETAWNTFTGNVLSVWEGIWDDIDTKIREIWGAIETFISTGIQNIVTFFTDAAQSMIDAGAGIIDNIRQGIEDTWQSILDYISYGLTGESGSVISQIIAALGTIRERAKEIVTAIRDGITEVWNNITGRIRALIEGTGGYSGIMQAVTDAWNKIKELGGGIVDAIKEGVTTFWNNVISALTTKLEGLGAVGTFVLAVWSKVSDLGKKIVNMIKFGLTYLWDAATGGLVAALKTRLERLKDALGSLTWDKVKEIGSKVVDWIKQGIISGWYAFVQWLKDMILGIFGSGATSAMQATGEKGGRLLMESIADGIYANADIVVGALGRTMAGVGPTDNWVGAMTPGRVEAGMMRAAAGFSASLGMVAPAMMAPAAVSSSTEVNIGPVGINNGMDMAEFEVRVRQAVSEAI